MMPLAPMIWRPKPTLGSPAFGHGIEKDRKTALRFRSAHHFIPREQPNALVAFLHIGLRRGWPSCKTTPVQPAVAGEGGGTLSMCEGRAPKRPGSHRAVLTFGAGAESRGHAPMAYLLDELRHHGQSSGNTRLRMGPAIFTFGRSAAADEFHPLGRLCGKTASRP